MEKIVKNWVSHQGLWVLGAALVATALLAAVPARAASVRALPPAGIAVSATPADAAPASVNSPVPARNVTVPKIQLDAFDEQRVALHSTTVESADQVMDNVELLDGNVIDARGQIMGILTQGEQKMVMVRLQRGVLSMQVASTLENSALLASGTNVRVLARVRTAPDGAVQLGLIDLASPSTQVDLAKIPDTSAVVLPPLAGTISALPAPPDEPVETVSAPSYEAVAQTSPSRSVAAAAPLSDDIVSSQKPVYAQMIAATNKKLTAAQANEIAEAILRAGLQYQMDPRFLAAIIGVESDYDIFCLSSSGAMGLGQIMPFNLKSAGVQDAWNPTQNVFGTARILRGHLTSFKDHPNGTLLAVAAYNAGPNAVRRAGNQVPNGAQVRRYVWKVYYRYKALAPDMF